MHHPEYDHAEDRQREPTTVGQPGQPTNDVDQRSHDMVSAFGRWGKCNGSKSCNEEQRAYRSEIVSWRRNALLPLAADWPGLPLSRAIWLAAPRVCLDEDH